MLQYVLQAALLKACFPASGCLAQVGAAARLSALQVNLYRETGRAHHPYQLCLGAFGAAGYAGAFRNMSCPGGPFLTGSLPRVVTIWNP